MQDTTDLLESAGSEEQRDTAGGAASASHTVTTLPIEIPAADGAGDVSSGEEPARVRRTRSAGGGLSAKTLAELQALAADLGVEGTSKLRKGQLIIAIQGAQAGGSAAAPAAETPETLETVDAAPAAEAPSSNGHAETTATVATADEAPATATAGETAEGETRPEGGDRGPREQREGGRDRQRNRNRDGQNRDGQNGQNGQAADAEGGEPRAANDGNGGGEGRERFDRNRGRNGQNRDGQNGNGQGNREGGRDGQNSGNQSRNNNNNDGGGGRNNDDDESGGRRGRYRDRRNRQNRNRDGGGLNEAEPTFTEDDVLVPVAGIVDILDNYAFVRTSGYLAGPNDVYVSLSQVRRYGLRRGDAVTGAIKQRTEGQPQAESASKRDKFNALVRLDTINGLDPERAQKRPEFAKLTPLYPNERLRLETEPNILTTRVIDLVMPVGKGQRALIVSPPKAGKTTIMQDIANAITRNNPECHLMVVLVDERPEEVTDMQRSVKGEVIASTFDRHPSDHITIAELSIERAKRLVEMGHDVVVLLDNITRLGRAYNLAAPASGRILTGGVDSAALYPPKRFLGAARNIEHGGSLTIFATALVETGSAMDSVIFEEFKGTGNAELKLDRKIADKRIFPAIDIPQTSTRKDELLMSREEMAILVRLRRVLHGLEGGQQAMELLLDKLRETKSNTEFLLSIQKTMPGAE